MDLATRQQGISSPQPVIDFDLHGVVGVRLIDPAARDAARLARRLAPFQATLQREPDITVRFERDLAPPAVNYLGLNSMAYTEEGFYLLDRSSGQVTVQIPFDRVGDPCEIICQRGLGSVPQLIELVKLAFLRKNYVSVHGAAFHYSGKGILVAGWSKGGKTETLVSFANHGAHYVADEWVLLSGDGQRMLGLPVRVALWDWQLEQMSPDLVPELSRERKFLFRGIHSLQAVHNRFGRGRFKRFLPLKTLDRLMPILKLRLSVRKVPHVLFKDRYCGQGTTIDKVFLTISHSEPDIVIRPCDPVELATRMLNSNEHESTSVVQQYRAFRFAFPQRENRFLERAPELHRSLLYQALEGKEAYEVFHPYPVSFEELFDHLQPLC
jgi:hypothetical protein